MVSVETTSKLVYDDKLVRRAETTAFTMVSEHIMRMRFRGNVHLAPSQDTLSVHVHLLVCVHAPTILAGPEKIQKNTKWKMSFVPL